MDRIVAPYGSWRSPITAEVATAGSVGLSRAQIDGDAVYWIETRPQEGGRSVIVRRDADRSTRDITPPGFNARTRVHEYGGGQYIAVDGVVYFANDADQRVYRQVDGRAPEPVTPEGAPAEPTYRYADFFLDKERNRLLCVREDHSGPGEAVNTIVAIDLPEGGAGTLLASGYDFYSNPRLDPSGRRMCWLCWRHPNMPWDGTELWLADVADDGAPQNARLVAGGPNESIFQPSWSPDGVLHFISDRTGWWNLYCLQDGEVKSLCPMAAEFGQPQWVFGQSTYGFLGDGSILCAYRHAGKSRLALLRSSGSPTEIQTPYQDIGEVRASGRFGAIIGGAPDRRWTIARVAPDEAGQLTILRGQESGIPAEYISAPEALTFPTTGDIRSYGYFYPPRHPEYAAPAAHRPPLIVMSHGGPTGSTSSTLDPEVQFRTSRGFAVLDVDYRGSTGYGRAYREMLNGQWGVADLEDCVNGARYLVERGEVDGERLAIRGGSAGGYTTLCALTFTDVFRAGASYYGVSDMIGLLDTHKFESRYLDSMIGPYPERRDLYQARSPINFTDRLSCPLILFQGSDDPVVPPSQSERIYEAARAKGLPVAYLTFDGEQHGFRQAKNIVRALEAELYFYGKAFGFEPADKIEPVKIENLPAG